MRDGRGGGLDIMLTTAAAWRVTKKSQYNTCKYSFDARVFAYTYKSSPYSRNLPRATNFRIRTTSSGADCAAAAVAGVWDA